MHFKSIDMITANISEHELGIKLIPNYPICEKQTLCFSLNMLKFLLIQWTYQVESVCHRET